LIISLIAVVAITSRCGWRGANISSLLNKIAGEV